MATSSCRLAGSNYEADILVEPLMLFKKPSVNSEYVLSWIPLPQDVIQDNFFFYDRMFLAYVASGRGFDIHRLVITPRLTFAVIS